MIDQRIIAIDPGQSGGIAYGDEHGTEFFPMPATPTDIYLLLKSFRNPDVVYLEKVGVRPGQGISSSGKFMEHFGFLQGVLCALGVRVVLVRPEHWMKALSLGTSKGMTKTQWKNKLKAEAQRLYPNRGLTLATADAALILEYGRRQP